MEEPLSLLDSRTLQWMGPCIGKCTQMLQFQCFTLIFSSDLLVTL